MIIMIMIIVIIIIKIIIKEHKFFLLLKFVSVLVAKFVCGLKKTDKKQT